MINTREADTVSSTTWKVKMIVKVETFHVLLTLCENLINFFSRSLQ
jgi:hypothetical protein